jgi:cytochrome o ubiquinol oxidase subunit 1
VLFGAFAGYSYWFPKAFGFKLHEGWGKAAFWFNLTGFYATFIPLYTAGLLGMTRRLQHYDVPQWQPWVLAAGAGMVLIATGVLCQIVQLVVSIRQREALKDVTGDPWDGRSLEWATASPPPAFNFPVLPNVEGPDAYWALKAAAREQQRAADEPAYEPIEMPRNSPTGVVCAVFATVVGFALIWHIWWLAIAGLLGAYATFVVFAWRDRSEDELSAVEVARIVRESRRFRAGMPRTEATS